MPLLAELCVHAVHEGKENRLQHALLCAHSRGDAELCVLVRICMNVLALKLGPIITCVPSCAAARVFSGWFA